MSLDAESFQIMLGRSIGSHRLGLLLANREGAFTVMLVTLIRTCTHLLGDAPRQDACIVYRGKYGSVLWCTLAHNVAAIVEVV